MLLTAVCFLLLRSNTIIVCRHNTIINVRVSNERVKWCFISNKKQSSLREIKQIITITMFEQSQLSSSSYL